MEEGGNEVFSLGSLPRIASRPCRKETRGNSCASQCWCFHLEGQAVGRWRRRNAPPQTRGMVASSSLTKWVATLRIVLTYQAPCWSSPTFHRHLSTLRPTPSAHFVGPQLSQSFLPCVLISTHLICSDSNYTSTISHSISFTPLPK